MGLGEIREPGVPDGCRRHISERLPCGGSERTEFEGGPAKRERTSDGRWRSSYMAANEAADALGDKG